MIEVKFVTRREDHHIQNSLVQIVKPSEIDLSYLLRTLNTRNTSTANSIDSPIWWTIGYDIENRFVTDASREALLLSAFCIDDTPGEEYVIVIDNTSVDSNEVFTPEILKRCIFISHNADHEARFGVVSNFVPGRYVCTMVNDRRLLSGQEGFRFDLISVINRRLGYKEIPVWMDKDIREQFRDCEFFTHEHILYNAADTIRLRRIYQEQLKQAAALNQLFLHRTINSRIITPIAEAETTGIKHDTPKWLAIAKEREIKAQQICQELNRIIVEEHGLNPGSINPLFKKKQEQLEKRSLRNEERRVKLEAQLLKLEKANKTHLKSYLITHEQLSKLKASELVKEENGIAETINWGSQKQVLEVLEQIGCQPPVAKDKKTYQPKAGLGKEARANWFVNNESSPFLPILQQFDIMKKLVHNVNSFGVSWVDQYVRNGRVYTLLDQAGADTGRFSSGSKGKKENKKHPNMQQVPKPKEYRECFIADDGRLMLTSDYCNCEGVLMIAQSGDLNMKKITELADQHSYLGTKCWRAVYAHRYLRTKDPKWLELSQTYEMNKSTPEKEKERDVFKNSGGLFPVAYGVFASKVAGAAKITVEEGQVMIDVIKAEIPLVIDYLDSVSKKAVVAGYAVHNTRTGSRRWFQKVLDNQHYGWKLSNSDKIEIESASRNTVIQGSNSDLVKEAIAMLHLWIKLYKQDVRFLLTVHDEIVIDCPADKGEFYKKKLVSIMERAAKNYLIPEIDMKAECKIATTWQK